MTPAVRCADCDALLVRGHNDQWATRLNGPGLSYTCRTKMAGGVLVEAYYHYVEGETQRRFRVKP